MITSQSKVVSKLKQNFSLIQILKYKGIEAPPTLIILTHSMKIKSLVFFNGNTEPRPFVSQLANHISLLFSLKIPTLTS